MLRLAFEVTTFAAGAPWTAPAAGLPVTPTRILAVGIVLAFILLSLPGVRRFLDARRAPAPALPGGALVVPMGRERLLTIHAFLGFLLVGSLIDIVFDREHWPFSQYGMYSETATSNSLDTLRLFGVPRDGSAEIALYDYRYIRPFDKSRMRWALESMVESGKGSGRAREAVADCLRRYEDLRKAGRHDGPPLRAMRLYRLHWTLDPELRNVDTPDRRELIVEVAAPDGGGK